VPAALVTGASRRAGIAAAAARALAHDGWDVATTCWRPYDESEPWGSRPEEAEELVVNAIDPGPSDTGWLSAELAEAVVRATPLGRLGRPEDAAELVAFLCSEHGGWITGQLLRSDGGFAWVRTPRRGREPL